VEVKIFVFLEGWGGGKEEGEMCCERGGGGGGGVGVEGVLKPHSRSFFGTNPYPELLSSFS